MANTNEAKIAFTAETGEFNEQIKKSEKTMASLRAEMNLCSTRMKATGKTVEALEEQHALLERQLQASREKAEALAGKIEVATRIFGANSNEVLELKTKLSQTEAAEERIRQALARCNQELEVQKAVAKEASSATRKLTDSIEGQEAAAKEASSATRKLTDSIEEQQTEVDALKDEYKEAVLQYGKHSKEARDLAKKIKSLSGELGDNKRKLSDAERAADKLDRSLDDTGDSARGAEDGFTVMKGAISDLVSSAIQWGIGQLSDFVGYLKELPEATRELRQDMATLETSFETAGFSTEQATETWKDLYTIFGEDDRAVEAANLISKMAKDQEDLNEWVTITQGVWGSYQDSLPVEGLAEASNETVKTGQVTGVLADALNWSGDAAKMFSKYMSEDVTTAEDAFNEALKECTTEEERQALITDTLTKLYGDAAKSYEEASGAQLKEKEAAAEATLAQANLAAAVAPATTAWDGLKTQLVTAVTPAIEKVCGWLSDAFSWLQAHPAALSAVATVAGVLGAVLTTLAIALTVASVAQWAMNSAVLANPITWIVVGIVAAVAALIAIGVALYKNWDTIKAKCSEVWNGIKSAFNNAKTAVVNAATNLKNGVVEKFNALRDSAREKFNSIKQKIVEPIETAKAKVKGAIDKIKGFFSGLKLKLPHIKLPHFKLTGEFSLSPPSVPKLGVEWYAKGGIFTRPTIFPTASGLKGVGEAGAEAVLPIEKLRDFIGTEIESHSQTAGLMALAESIRELADRPIGLNVNGRQFATAVAGDADSVNGLRSRLIERGLAL